MTQQVPGTDRRGERRMPGVLLPAATIGPLLAVLYRLLLAVAFLLLAILVVYLDRDGYRDSAGSPLSLLDSAYYATVTLSTTGYGDITPVTAQARLINLIFITPLRVLFLIILVGTTLEVLAESTHREWRISRWRHRVRDHIVVVGYGTKGRAAIRTLLSGGVTKDHVVVVDPDPRAVAEANADGLTGIVGDATRSDVLERAEVRRAREVIISAQRDDTAVLATLTARQLNPDATIVTAVREAENAPLLRQSGADHVVTSSEAAGRLLGMSTIRPTVSAVIQDLLDQGTGLDLSEREVAPGEVGAPPAGAAGLVIAVVREGRVVPAESVDRLVTGDRLIVVSSAAGVRGGPQR